MELLFYIRVERENFQIEDFESQYNILMLVEKGCRFTIDVLQSTIKISDEWKILCYS